MSTDMLEKVFKAPINLFFDVTPAGLILKRFSEDVGGVEHIINHYTHLQRMFNLFAYTLVMVYMVDRKILLLAPVMIF
jgi:ATP-binding cassette subfamily C (CFTR/MRP) protein 10